jgi:ATP-dependent RNA helicase HelY
MPAKTVVIEDLWKFSGERHELLTPGEYTQFTGRAGRRGIDEIGYAVVLYQRQVPFERVAGLASTRTYELRSSFRPSYNMAVNLVRNYSREEARHLLNQSFAQFLADRGVVTLERQLERDRAYLDGYLARIACDRGDFLEYWHLREEAERGTMGSRESAARATLAALRPGDVVSLPSVRRRGLAAVVATSDGRPMVVTEERRAFRLLPREVHEVLRPLARIELPRSGSSRSARFRRDVAADLAALTVRRPEPEPFEPDPELRRRVEEHPCHRCPDRPEHERWARRAAKLEQEVRGLERRIRSRTETLGRQFDRVLAVLQDLGEISDFTLTDKGERLRHIYGEGDILVVEALADGLFDDLDPAEVASLTSCVVFESRERTPRPPEIPPGRLGNRYRRLAQLWSAVRRSEDAHQVQLCRELDAGFMVTALDWAEGKPLEDVLAASGMPAGDFVRTCKQLLDLLRQIEEVAEPGLAEGFAEARLAVNRSVVSYTGLEPDGA